MEKNIMLKKHHKEKLTYTASEARKLAAPQAAIQIELLYTKIIDNIKKEASNGKYECRIFVPCEDYQICKYTMQKLRVDWFSATMHNKYITIIWRNCPMDELEEELKR